MNGKKQKLSLFWKLNDSIIVCVFACLLFDFWLPWKFALALAFIWAILCFIFGVSLKIGFKQFSIGRVRL